MLIERVLNPYEPINADTRVDEPVLKRNPALRNLGKRIRESNPTLAWVEEVIKGAEQTERRSV